MSWKLSAVPHKVFARNPLVAVVAQVRFHPILQVPKRIPEFQDLVRARFPRFEERAAQQVAFGGLPGLAPVSVRQEQQFLFRNPDGSATLTLGQEAIALEDRRHESRNAFLESMGAALKALIETVRVVAPTRLGLRYVNVVDRERVSRDLGRPVTWEDLLDASLLAPVGDRASLDGTRYYVETSSPMGEGDMTVRHGLLVDPGATDPLFRLDIDRYLADAVEPDQVVGLLERFSDDIFHVFVSAAGVALTEWLDG